jgi:HSP20 family protein
MMDLIRWNPWNELVSLRERMNRMFEDSLFRPERHEDGVGLGAWSPAVDMFEKDDKFVIKAELPGLDKKDVNVDLQNGVLTLKGERKHESEVKEENFYRREMSYGKFMRSFRLPADVDADKIRAEFQNGLLTVEVPKPEEHKPKQIKVN